MLQLHAIMNYIYCQGRFDPYLLPCNAYEICTHDIPCTLAREGVARDDDELFLGRAEEVFVEIRRIGFRDGADAVEICAATLSIHPELIPRLQFGHLIKRLVHLIVYNREVR